MRGGVPCASRLRWGRLTAHPCADSRRARIVRAPLTGFSTEGCDARHRERRGIHEAVHPWTVVWKHQGRVLTTARSRALVLFCCCFVLLLFCSAVALFCSCPVLLLPSSLVPPTDFDRHAATAPSMDGRLHGSRPVRGVEHRRRRRKRPVGARTRCARVGCQHRDVLSDDPGVAEKRRAVRFAGGESNHRVQG